MPTMLGGKNSRGLTDFLLDPAKAQAMIKSHKDAAQAHAVAAADFKKQKADALEVIDQLNQQKAAHEETANRLKSSYSEINNIRAELEKRSLELDLRDKALIEERANLDVLNNDYKVKIRQFNLQNTKQEMEFAQKERSLADYQETLNRELISLEKRREKIEKREKDIIDLAFKLTDR